MSSDQTAHGPPVLTRVGLVLLSALQDPIPSTRIAALNMFPFLRAAGMEPRVLFAPDLPTETPELPNLLARAREQHIQVVVFQKVHGPSALEQMRLLASAGIKTVYAVCDLVDAQMAAAADATVVVTDYLKSLYPAELQSKIHVVHDGIEHPEMVKTAWSSHRGSAAHPLHAVLVTSMELDRLPVLQRTPDWLKISIVGRYPPQDQYWQRLRTARWTLARQSTLRDRLAFLRFLADRRIRRIAWDPVGVYNALQTADLAIIPIDRPSGIEPASAPPAWKIKSENRLTLAMAIGLPVVATPIPSYEPLVEQGRNGFLAESAANWLTCLEHLRDPSVRVAIGNRARATVIQRYSKEEQARRLISVLQSLCNG